MAKNNASVTGSTPDRIYNPFPRAVGHAARSGMTRGAAHVLSRLGVFTNFAGETFAGFDLLVEETQGSRQYVSEALTELYALKRLTRQKRYNKRTGERLSDTKQIWVTPEELLASGVKESNLGLYPAKKKEYLDIARSAFQTKDNDKSSTPNKKHRSPKSGIQTDAKEVLTQSVSSDVTFEPKSSEP